MKIKQYCPVCKSLQNFYIDAWFEGEETVSVEIECMSCKYAFATDIPISKMRVIKPRIDIDE